MAAAGRAVSLRRLDYDHLSKVAVLSATFFVASLIHFPIGPTSFHLTLNGLIGVILGWAAFPALLAHLPLMAVEGLATGAVAAFLRRVRPELLAAPLKLARTEEMVQA